ncbi:type I-E CRISPR-associated protein Cas6/Cse3/CasE [Citrobacter braakii]|uniref:type I-E CRISPR-associated protein Cas6/Cse3/CasE n=1 Tax=Citrobacter braakii TaxID=57706 RepID=UPI0011EF0507|nr:type I-E CRISPR-associated protein Cas6/Cse3/CasE [Citrobacter braakii]EMC3651567.1 type I-E CRISPR-associated protein Cas6/Cse3/CasE [Citrobacter braakii]KAA0555617.1 type I-E CRISPR-associated protein Cas6/Cse3/CasE [Citrobacter braakii]MBJ8973452.1 type I-E CRISPR-associated protein Cas6/Cse3/CasE [Citrobacter braakii]MDT7127889.1 type I-E CRISPR-associated protein Cas6/Cse3/CasE [Citrobacter braakii]
MYLSKIFVNWRWTRDPYQLHRALWQLFPDRADMSRDFLFRLEELHTGKGGVVLLQSMLSPCDAIVAQVVASKPLGFRLEKNARLRFRLRANPVKTIKDAQRRQNSRGEVKSCRVPLIDEGEQTAWLQRKLSGIAVLEQCRITQEKALFFQKNNRNGKIQPVCFDGFLTVSDTDKFNQILIQGIGPAKAMGCGLLSIA